MNEPVTLQRGESIMKPGQVCKEEKQKEHNCGGKGG